LDYLLIRLITVFDPAFCRVFFFASFLAWLQANEVWVQLNLVAAMIAKECRIAIERPSPKPKNSKAALENQSHSL
jgi:hypothetical protein